MLSFFIWTLSKTLLWFLYIHSSVSFCCRRKFSRFIWIFFVSHDERIIGDGGDEGTSSARGGGSERTVRIVMVVVRVSILASSIASFSSGFTGLRFETVRFWRIWIAGRDSCAVKEWLVVALLQVPAISSEKGAVTVNRCGGGTCNWKWLWWRCA